MSESAPVTESAPITAASPDAIDSIVSESVAQALQDSAPESPTGRDEKGRFTPKATDLEEVPGETAPPPVVEIATDGEDADEPAPVVLPEGFVAVPKVERELATSFTVLDKDGELEIPDLLLKFNANGKERTEPLDKVVRMAQMGVYNEAREAAVQTSRQEAQQATQRVQEITAYAQRLEREQQQLLEDDHFYLTKRQQYEESHTPEARLAQANAQAERAQQETEFVQVSNLGSQFLASQVSPAVDQITKALPTVSEEEIAAKLLLITNRHLVQTPFGSIIPPRAYSAITQAIVHEVVPWAQQVHDDRDHRQKDLTAKSTAETLAAKQAASKAQADAQKASNTLAKGIRPGTQGRAAKDTPPPKPIRTVEDAEQSALSETLAAMHAA